MPPRSVAIPSAAVLLVLGLLPSPVAHAQRESFEGSAARAQAKAQEDRLLDLNGDGKVDDHERELVLQNLRLQKRREPEHRGD